jgi:hypothetical protein
MALDNTFPLIDSLKKTLFTPEERRLQGGIDRLVDQAGDDDKQFLLYLGFSFSGDHYRHSRHQVIHKHYPVLPFALNDEMEKWLKDKKAVALDKDQIGQMLFKLLYQANDLQEMRDTLPDCLISLIPTFSGMSRKFEQEFLIRHNPRDLKQFHKILPKIELYAMSKLIY